RRADGDVRAHGRIEGDQRAFGGVAQARVALDDAVEDRLAVFDLTDLEIGGVAHRLYEISRVVDQEQPELAALDLAGQDEGAGEVDLALLEIAAVDLVNLAQGAPDH